MILNVIELVLMFVSLVVAIPVFVVFVETTSALFGKQRLNESDQSGEELTRPACGILMPAHNEAAVIEETLKSLMPHLRSDDQVIVVADNCSDETAQLARQYPVRVEERTNLEQRGKGYALAHGLQQWGAAVPEVVVIMDADCRLRAGSLEQLVSVASSHRRPAQALNLLEAPLEPTLKYQVSTFAFQFKNQVRQLGLHVLGLPCSLSGTGMAFPQSLISPGKFATGNIVEDMQLGIDLLITGHPAVFVPQARILGRFPSQEAAATSQRTRWEHGHISTLLTQVPRLLKAAWNQRRLDLFAIALDLCVPPLSLLVMIWVASAILVLFLAIFSAPSASFWITLASGCAFLTAISTSWYQFGRDTIPLKSLLAVPQYLLWKLPVYLRFVFRRETDWVRTERDKDTDSQTKRDA